MRPRPFSQLAIALIACLLPATALAVGPHPSFSQLTTGNGFGFTVYDASRSRVTFFSDHPYAQHAATEGTRQFAFDAYFGLRASGAGAWLGELPVDAVDYRDQSNVIHATQSSGPLRAETYVFSPWGVSAPAAVMVLHVTNVSQLTLTDASAYALMNFHLGSGSPPGTDGEHIVWDGTNSAYTETGASGATLAYVPFGLPTHHGASPSNPYPIVHQGGSLVDVADSGVTNDAVAGFQWDFASLAPNGDAWVGVVITIGSPSDARAWLANRDPSAVTDAEAMQWNAWRAMPPANLTPAELRVWRQSETVLRMAQSREPAPAAGQIVAALPPGPWWIAWVRDMSYATAALARSGHMAEANAAIDFFHGAHTGMYQTYVGHPYSISVVRYYGNGDEWSDTNQSGPNIEFDGFGLAPWAARLAGRHDLDANGDTLRALIDRTGLISPDSSIWEVHWNGQQKHFGYTSIAAAQALCALGDATHARSIRDALVSNLELANGGLAGNLEELQRGQGALDAAVVEAIDFGLIDPHGRLANQTLQAFEALRTPVGRGFFRNDHGGGYDSQEWVFIDLRIADAYLRVGRTQDANELIAWVTAQADANFGLQAELYDRLDADYLGSTPMVGFGAGAYMLTLLDRAQLAQPDPTCFPPEQDVGHGQVGDAGADAGPNPYASGCSVGGPARGNGLVFVAIALIVLAVRRRRVAALLAVLLAACNGGAQGDAGDASFDSYRADAPPSASGLPVRDCTARFTYPLGHSATNVVVAGEWNMFSTTRDHLSDGLGTGTYRGALDLSAGTFGYKFWADGNFALDPTNGLSDYVNGIENSRLDVPDCTHPAWQVLRADAASDRTVSIDLQYLDGTMRAGMDAHSLAIQLGRMPLDAGAITVDAMHAQVSIRYHADHDDKFTFHIDVQDMGGRAADTLTVPMWVEPEPYQWGDGAMYFVFTDRFRNGDPSNDAPVAGVDTRANYQGGDFAGVLAALREGYFDALGVKVIWLSPVNQNTNMSGIGTGGHLYSAYHGYWVSAPRTVEEHWGSLDDLRAITAEAHRRGIRVVLDLVQNQLHMEHPYFQMHPDWFNGDGSCVCGGPNCDWDTHRLDCWFTPYLPDVNWTNMSAVDRMISDALFWLTEADVDGFRVDAVKHMQNIATTTLRIRIHQTMETGNARYYLVGETFVGEGDRAFVESYISPDQLWGQFDFPLYWQIDQTFAQNQGVMADLDNAVQQGEQTYTGAVMSPFLGNQDVERFLSRAAGQITGGDQPWTNPPTAPNSDDPYNRLFLAYTFLLTQRGVPLIYYGDEIGMPGAADPDNRRMMRFGADLSAREQNLLHRVQIVAHARGTHPGLRRGARTSLYTDGDGYVYARGADADLAVVAINRGSTSRMVHVTVPATLASDGTTLHDLLGGPSITVTGGAVDVPFTPQGAALFVR